MSQAQYLFIIFMFSFAKIVMAQAETVDFSVPNEVDVPAAYAVNGWREVPYYTTWATDLNKTPKLALNCVSPKLYPTHADQSLKHYHQFNSTSFNNAKLRHDESACLLPSRYKNGAGNYYCQRSDLLYTAVISDTFRDSCGNFYRGYTRVTYLLKDENMGTLFSLGRTMYPKRNSTYPGDVEMGATYETDVADFLFLGPLLAGDEARIKKAFIENQKGHLRFDPSSLLFRDIR